MSSVNGLVTVCVYKARGIVAPPAAHLYVRLRLLPWKEEKFTGSVVLANESDEAVWDSEDTKNEVTLAHLSTTASSAPSIEVELRSRELYVYDRSLGSGKVDISDLVAENALTDHTPQRKAHRETWVSLDAQQGTPRILLRLAYTRGASRLIKAAMRRIASDDAFRQHLFRLTSYNRPTWCAVCDGLLVGIRHQGFKCEACGLDCHPDCQLKAHASYECKPDAWRREKQAEPQAEEVEAEITNELSLDEEDDVASILSSIEEDNEHETELATAHISHTTTPVRENTIGHTTASEKRVSEPRKISIDETITEHSVSPRLGGDTTATPRLLSHSIEMETGHTVEDTTSEQRKAVGRLRIKLHSCKLLDDRNPGDHYVRLSLRASRQAAASKSRRTHTVYQSASPVFEVTWNLDVDTFGSIIYLELVDAARDNVVGTLWFGVHALLQEPADFVAGQWAKSALHSWENTLRRGSKQDELNINAQEPVLEPDVWYFAQDENRFFRDARGIPTAIAEFEDCELEVYSDDFFWCMAPRDAPWDYWPETFSLEIAKKHINRARTVIRSISAVYASYEDIMRWRDPFFTLVLFVLYMTSCIYLNAEYAGVVPIVMLAVLMLITLRNRLFRQRPRSRYFDAAAKTLADKEGLGDQRYRPLAKLKIAVCAGRFIEAADYYAVVAYIHGPPLVDEEKAAPQKAIPPVVTTPLPKSDAHATTTAQRRRRKHYRRKRTTRSASHGDAFEDDPRSEDELLLDLLNEDDDSDESDDQNIPLDIDPQQQPLGGLVVATEEQQRPLTSSQDSRQQQHTSAAATTTASTKTLSRSNTKNTLVEHVLGYTGTCRKTSEPRWHDNMGLALDARRRRVDATGVLSRLVGSLSNDAHGTATGLALMDAWERRGFGDQSLVDRALVHPVLQPVTNDDSLLPWTKCGGQVLFTVFKANALDRHLDAEIGRVSVPLPSLVDENSHSGTQRERRGWYTLELAESVVVEEQQQLGVHEKNNGNTRDRSGSQSTAIPLPSRGSVHNGTSPAINVRLQLELCAVRSSPSENELITSRAVDAMIKPLTDNEEQSTYTRGLLSTKAAAAATAAATRGNPLSTVVSVHANATYAQNCLGLVLDVLESFKNALNWTHPHKTLFLFICTLLGVVVFARIPTRWLLMSAGLYEFTVRLLPFGSGSPMTTRFLNLLKALPNDADLDAFYHFRALNHARQVVKAERKRRRRAKIHAIWEPRFEDSAYLRDDASQHLQDGSGDTSSSGSLRRRRNAPIPNPDTTTCDHWGKERYFILQGRRLLWWNSERDLDIGRAPGEQLLLLGHCGLTDPSPTDLAACSQDSQHLLLAIFGQDIDGAPLRWSLRFRSTQAKARFITAVELSIPARPPVAATAGKRSAASSLGPGGSGRRGTSGV